MKTFLNINGVESSKANEPNKYNITNEAYNFAQSLYEVLNNKDKNKKQAEHLIYDMANHIFEAVGFNKPVFNSLRSTTEHFYCIINNTQYTGEPDKVIINIFNQNICIIREDKHCFTTTYKKGDIQLTANIIAAYLYNKKYALVYPNDINKIIGIKIISDYVEFITVQISNDYINYIECGKLSMLSKAYVKKYCPGSLANPKERKHIFECLENIKDYYIQYIN